MFQVAGEGLVLAFAAGHTLLIVAAGASASRVQRAVAGVSARGLQTWRYASGVLVIVGGLVSRLALSIFLAPVLYALVARDGDVLKV